MKKNQNQDILKRGIISLVLMIIVSFIIYTGLLISTTISITQTRDAQKMAQNLRSEIADLEASYLTKAQVFSLEYAFEKGYKVVELPYFARLSDNQELAILSFKHE